MQSKSIKLTPFFLFLIFFIFSCTKDTYNLSAILSGLSKTSGGFRKFVIEKGNHYCDNNFYPPFTDTALHFTVVFDSSAIYNFTDIKTKYDNNKLYGFADNGSNHLQFSARFGWRWFNNELELAAYTYNNGIVKVVQLGKVELGAENKCAIVVKGDHYNFIINGVTTPIARESKTAEAVGYKLYPYFGGDATAPHTVTILIKDDK